MSGNENAGAEAGSARRRKKRGSNNRNKQQETAIPPHLHVMYQEDDEGAFSHGQKDDERDASDV